MKSLVPLLLFLSALVYAEPPGTHHPGPPGGPGGGGPYGGPGGPYQGPVNGPGPHQGPTGPGGYAPGQIPEWQRPQRPPNAGKKYDRAFGDTLLSIDEDLSFDFDSIFERAREERQARVKAEAQSAGQRYFASNPQNPCQGCPDPTCRARFIESEARRMRHELNTCKCKDPACGTTAEEGVKQRLHRTLPLHNTIQPHPDRYTFVSPPGNFRTEITQQYEDLSRLNPTTEKGQEARELGLSATREADQAYSQNFEGDALFYKEIGKSFLDIAVGMDPVTSFGRSTYELFTGKNLVTGEELSTFERSMAGLNVLSAGTSGSLTRISTGIVRIAGRSGHTVRDVLVAGQRAVQRFREAKVSAQVLRNSPGVATTRGPLRASGPMVSGTHGNAGKIPQSIADRMSGREYRNFKEFRQDLWREVAASPYAEEFSYNSANLGLMRDGKSPLARVEQHHIGPRATTRKYELHHLEPIQNGGAVYDMNNIVVVSPKFHKEILDPTVHYGNGR
jgi:hypothetical protein